jgi:hypothetical protein
LIRLRASIRHKKVNRPLTGFGRAKNNSAGGHTGGGVLISIFRD